MDIPQFLEHPPKRGWLFATFPHVWRQDLFSLTWHQPLQVCMHTLPQTKLCSTNPPSFATPRQSLLMCSTKCRSQMWAVQWLEVLKEAAIVSKEKPGEGQGWRYKKVKWMRSAGMWTDSLSSIKHSKGTDTANGLEIRIHSKQHLLLMCVSVCTHARWEENGGPSLHKLCCLMLSITAPSLITFIKFKYGIKWFFCLE